MVESHETQHLKLTKQNAQGLPQLVKKVFVVVISLKTFHPHLKNQNLPFSMNGKNKLIIKGPHSAR